METTSLIYFLNCDTTLDIINLIIIAISIFCAMKLNYGVRLNNININLILIIILLI